VVVVVVGRRVPMEGRKPDEEVILELMLTHSLTHSLGACCQISEIPMA
jgi:hypothetical protein